MTQTFPYPDPSRLPPPDAPDAAEGLFPPLAQELHACAAAGCRIEWWWRDDDAIADTPELRRLLEASDQFRVPVMIAAIPVPCEPSLAAALRAAPLVSVAQHGLAHVNHEPETGHKSEFGPSRPLAEVRAEIAEGRERLRGLFGDTCLPVFVPPWNRLRPDAWPLLPELGLRGLSAYGRQATAEAAAGVRVVNTHLDILDWSASPPRLAAPEWLVEALLAALRDRREGSWPAAEPIGVLTHHRVMSRAAWEFVDRLFSLLAGMARCRPARELFRLT